MAIQVTSQHCHVRARFMPCRQESGRVGWCSSRAVLQVVVFCQTAESARCVEVIRSNWAAKFAFSLHLDRNAIDCLALRESKKLKLAEAPVAAYLLPTRRNSPRNIL